MSLLKRFRFALCIILFSTSFAFLFIGPAQASRSAVDLHAHLDIKPGVGPLLRGDFLSPPRSQTWTDRLSSKTSSHSLHPETAPALIVFSLYGHPFLSGLTSTWSDLDRKANVQNAIEHEYQNLIRFLNSDEGARFGIAKTPAEAETLIALKRTPIVLSIEGAYGTLETEEHRNRWIRDRGVAIVTPFHLTGDHFGGNALMSRWNGLFSSPIQFFQAILASGGECFSQFCKSQHGMSNEGRGLLDELFRQKVWVDLSHANDLQILEIVPLLKTQGQPVLVTHTLPRSIFPAERGISDALLQTVIDQDGVIGLMPTDDMLLKRWGSAVGAPTKCFSGLIEFKKTVRVITEAIGAKRVVLASDINAPLTGLSPVCEQPSGQLLSPLEEQGFYTYSQWPELSQYVAPDLEWTRQGLLHFLAMWKRVQAETKPSLKSPKSRF